MEVTAGTQPLRISGSGRVFEAHLENDRAAIEDAMGDVKRHRQSISGLSCSIGPITLNGPKPSGCHVNAKLPGS